MSILGTPILVLKRDAVFGDCSDDDGTGTVTLATATWNASTEDTGVIEKQYKNLIIPSGVTITAGNRNSGIIIRCQGDCTIHGSIKNLLAPKSLLEGSTELANLEALYPSWMVSNGCGGNGGDGGEVDTSMRGYGQTGRFYGGGYSGGGQGGRSNYSAQSNNGGSATGITINTNIFVGGAGGAVSGKGYASGSAGAYGGGGGGSALSSSASSWSQGGTGGSGAKGTGGNASGDSSHPDYNMAGGGGGAGNYGGGVVIIFCRGNLTIDGALYCNGSNGGTGGSKYAGSYSCNGCGGGGGGGGRIYVMAKGTIALTGTFNVDGGSGGSGYTSGSTGGAGTKYYIAYADYNEGAGTPTAF